jgi:hypothetical protein
MYNRWFNMAVVLLWLATMGWLVKSKVLPPLLVGEPPSYETIVDARRSELPVGWRLAMDGRPVGWALTTTTVQPNGMVEIGSHVHFDELPLDQLAPGWLRTSLGWLKKPSLRQGMDARSVLFLDPLGRLTRFESTVGIDTVKDLISLKGELLGNQALVSIRSGEFVYRSEVRLPSGALLSDALQPQSRLPGLRHGQTWTVPVYSPLRPPNAPMEILHAEVEGYDVVPWEGRMERVWLVVYKNDPGAGLSSSRQDSRGRLWVRRDGIVVRQEVTVLGTRLTFSRIPEDEAVALQEIADAHQVPEARQAPTHVERGSLDWPDFPFDPGALPSTPGPLPTDHDPLR